MTFLFASIFFRNSDSNFSSVSMITWSSKVLEKSEVVNRNTVGYWPES